MVFHRLFPATALLAAFFTATSSAAPGPSSVAPKSSRAAYASAAPSAQEIESIARGVFSRGGGEKIVLLGEGAATLRDRLVELFRKSRPEDTAAFEKLITVLPNETSEIPSQEASEIFGGKSRQLWIDLTPKANASKKILGSFLNGIPKDDLEREYKIRNALETVEIAGTKLDSALAPDAPARIKNEAERLSTIEKARSYAIREKQATAAELQRWVGSLVRPWRRDPAPESAISDFIVSPLLTDFHSIRPRRLIPEIMEIPLGGVLPKSLLDKYDSRTLSENLAYRYHRLVGDKLGARAFSGSGDPVDMANDFELIIQIPEDKFDLIAANGVLNQHQTQTSSAALNLPRRAQFEDELFGMRLEESYSVNPSNPVNTVRPKYGLVNMTQREAALGGGGAKIYYNYGEVILELRPEVKARASYLRDDSLNSYAYSEMYKSPDLVRRGQGTFYENLYLRKEGGMYDEAQVLGEVDLRDTQAILLPEGAALDPKYTKSGLPVFGYSKRQSQGKAVIEKTRLLWPGDPDKIAALRASVERSRKGGAPGEAKSDAVIDIAGKRFSILSTQLNSSSGVRESVVEGEAGKHFIVYQLEEKSPEALARFKRDYIERPVEKKLGLATPRVIEAGTDRLIVAAPKGNAGTSWWNSYGHRHPYHAPEFEELQKIYIRSRSAELGGASLPMKIDSWRWNGSQWMAFPPAESTGTVAVESVLQKVLKEVLDTQLPLSELQLKSVALLIDSDGPTGPSSPNAALLRSALKDPRNPQAVRVLRELLARELKPDALNLLKETLASSAWNDFDGNRYREAIRLGSRSERLEFLEKIAPPVTRISADAFLYNWNTLGNLEDRQMKALYAKVSQLVDSMERPTPESIPLEHLFWNGKQWEWDDPNVNLARGATPALKLFEKLAERTYYNDDSTLDFYAMIRARYINLLPLTHKTAYLGKYAREMSNPLDRETLVKLSEIANAETAPFLKDYAKSTGPSYALCIESGMRRNLRVR